MVSGKKSRPGSNSKRANISPERKRKISAEANSGFSAGRSKVALRKGTTSKPYSSQDTLTPKAETSDTRPVAFIDTELPLNTTKRIDDALCQLFNTPTASLKEHVMYLYVLERFGKGRADYYARALSWQTNLTT